MTDESFVKNPKNILRRMIPGVFLGFVVFLGVALLGDLREVQSRVEEFEWRYYPVAILLTLFNYCLRFLKWHYYLGQIGVKNLAWPESLKLFVGGFPLAVTPGKVGEALKGVWLKQKSGLPVGRGISVVVAERISDGLAVLGLSSFGVLAYPRYWPFFLGVLAILGGVIVLSQIRPAALWVLSVGETIPLVSKFIHGIREFYEGSYALFRPRPTLLAVLLGMTSWLGEGIGFYLILVGLGIEPGLKSLGAAVFILAFSTVVGAASALPGGLGAAELSIGGMLALIVGISPSEAAAATLLIRLATFWLGLGLGILVWVLSPDLIGLRKREEMHVEG
ncbi:MAG: flippase-like domain-containing protein [Anaerolineae bacterium]|nr:flippase-like domain-containing protein [Anaerolineae bacterium]